MIRGDTNRPEVMRVDGYFALEETIASNDLWSFEYRGEQSIACSRRLELSSGKQDHCG